VRKNPFVLREPQHERDSMMVFKYLAARPEPVEGRVAIFSHDHRVRRDQRVFKSELFLLRVLGASALKIVADPSYGGSAVQSPSLCFTGKPQDPFYKARPKHHVQERSRNSHG
jgi:hypothetical protein